MTLWLLSLACAPPVLKDPCEPVTWYADGDEDGFGDEGASVEACEAPSGFVDNADDCDDTDLDIHPDADEVCDGEDNDCDEQIDDDDDSLTEGTVFYADGDGDGFGATAQSFCELPGQGWSEVDGDCDDADPDVNPDATEVCDDVDNDCDERIDDDDDSIDPDSQTAWYLDDDGDGFGAGEPVLACEAPSDHVDVDGDCEDGLYEVNPDATEVCDDGLDNDCDGTPNTCGLSGSFTESDADYRVFSAVTVGDLGTDLVVADALLWVSAPFTGANGKANAGRVCGFSPLAAENECNADEVAAMVGDGSSDKAGSALGAGDLNGDGYDELLIGIPNDDLGAANGGAVHLFYGSASGFSGDTTAPTSADVSWSGSDYYQGLGLGIRLVGDVNDDGLDDVALGAPGYGDDKEGAVFLIFGASRWSTQRVDLAADMTLEGATPAGGMGPQASLPAGSLDLDGDGVDDLAVGDPASDSVWVLYGDSSLSGVGAISDAADAQLEGDTASNLGFGVDAGDMDGDGYHDLALGAPSWFDGADAVGAVYMVPGASTRSAGGLDVSTSASWSVVGSQDALLGMSVAVGSADGDDHDDVLIGAPGLGSTSESGAAVLFYSAGQSGQQTLGDAGASFAPTESGGQAGNAVYLLDADGDGIHEIWIPQPGVEEVWGYIAGGL